MMRTLLIATRNAGKYREFRALLADLPIQLSDLRAFPAAPDVEETGDSYLANARAKAVQLARFTGLPTLADDSGLEVDALGGAPGVRSARFAGANPASGRNIALLLGRLRGVPQERRRARFRCVIVVAQPDGRELVGEGTCEGFITTEPHGTRGFGYDPVFYYPPLKSTFAELAETEKNRISHRARAWAQIRAQLPSFLGLPSAGPR